MKGSGKPGPFLLWRGCSFLHIFLPDFKTENAVMRSTMSVPFVALLIAGCASIPGFRPNIPAEEEALRNLDRALLDAERSHEVERVLPFYAADAVVLLENQPPVVGAAEIRAAYEAFFRLPVTAMTGAPTKIEVARSGDMAYMVARSYMTVATPSGSVADTGAYLVVFKKGLNSTWQIAGLSFSSSKPAVVPASPVADDASVREGIARATREHAAALMRGDVEGAMAPYTDDVMLQVGGRTYRGRASAEELNRGTLAGGRMEDLTYTTEELTVAGDAAFEIGRGNWTAVAADGTRSPRTYRYFAEWRRQPDGTWKLRRGVGDLPRE